ncbi:neurotrophin 1 isoform X1 [Colias croceus]|uniref:neurotrophin 1 isoform X1 n=1 Tax=Colias crocea TaxID=72248 RepID=UPI001E27DAD9|nr:neurotrophin 1 isoform X1 [Colias croceus]
MLLVNIVLIFALARAQELDDFEFYDPEEMMIAQKSRHYETIVKPPVKIVKPRGVTNSHRPQYNIDSIEADDDLVNIRKEKEGMIRDAVLRALEKRNNMGKFAQILPIIRAMSGNQRVALASLVASQVTNPHGKQYLNINQVRSLLNNNSTADLMLPILLDTANLFRKALRSGKQPRDIRFPRQQFQRRSYTKDTFDDEPFDIGVQDQTRLDTIVNAQEQKHEPKTESATLKPDKFKMPPRNLLTKLNNTDIKVQNKTDVDDNRNVSRQSTDSSKTKLEPSTRNYDNGTLDLITDATNQTISQDLPVAEKLRSLNRYIDRKGNLIRRGTYPPKPPQRRTTAEPTIGPITRRRPIPARKLPVPNEHAQCELFTNTLCLHSEDYPTDAIMQSIRRNKAAGALLADFKEPGEGAVDGITAAQEAKYTADHYLISNRRGDTANRDFAGAGEAGFMCPSTVKYARPQRARATSGQWKYIVNTGEHTQTLRLEKCLKPKEPCTYLTDNFKSKCVQVYNYHRLLTWDQQNGLHMDIFKVPTCCSCHIEGYSVSFPPVGQRVHETSSEHFPGEDLSSEQGNGAYEDVQQSVHRPSLNKSPGFGFSKPTESFTSYGDTQNDHRVSSFSSSKVNIDDLNNIQTGPKDSYGNSYYDTFNQASSIRSVKRPVPRNPAGLGNPPSLLASDSATLPSYLEPPTPSAPSSSFSFSKDSVNKYKINDQYKRTPVRPNRRPIRKKISAVPDDLMSSGTSAIGAYQPESFDTIEEMDDDLEEPNVAPISHNVPRPTIATKLHSVTENKFSHNREQTNMKTSGDDSGKKINYNYHPIIDFFGDEEKEENESIDREDNLDSYSTSLESEWKPINHTPIDRRKH